MLIMKKLYVLVVLLVITFSGFSKNINQETEVLVRKMNWADESSFERLNKLGFTSIDIPDVGTLYIREGDELEVRETFHFTKRNLTQNIYTFEDDNIEYFYTLMEVLRNNLGSSSFEDIKNTFLFFKLDAKVASNELKTKYLMPIYSYLATVDGDVRIYLPDDKGDIILIESGDNEIAYIGASTNKNYVVKGRINNKLNK